MFVGQEVKTTASRLVIAKLRLLYIPLERYRDATTMASFMEYSSLGLAWLACCNCRNIQSQVDYLERRYVVHFRPCVCYEINFFSMTVCTLHTGHNVQTVLEKKQYS